MYSFRYSMDSYFEHIKNKTYIDKYPSSIIRFNDLRGSVLFEFGAGVGNDARFLLENRIIFPENIFLFEPDIYCVVDLCDNLEMLLSGYGMKHIRPVDVFQDLEFYYSDIADFIYANNFLHCLGYKSTRDLVAQAFCERIGKGMIKESELPYDVVNYWRNINNLDNKGKIKKFFELSYKILRSEGVLFGRTLSNKLDYEKLDTFVRKKELSEKEIFIVRTTMALSSGELIGLSSNELLNYASVAGFKKFYFEKKTISSWSPISDFYFRIEK